MALTGIAVALGKSLIPLQLALDDAGSLQLLLRRLGWAVEIADEHLSTIRGLLAIADAIDEVIAQTDRIVAAGVGSADEIQALLEAVQVVREGLNTVSSVASSEITSLPSPLNTTSFWADLAVDLPEYLLVDYLRVQQPVLHGLLCALDVVVDVEPRGDSDRRQELRWSALTSLVQDLAAHVQSAFGWGSTLQYDKLLDVLLRMARKMGLTARRRSIRDELADQFFHPDHSALEAVQELDVLLHARWRAEQAGYLEAGVLILPIPEGTDDPESSISGLLISNLVWGSFGTDLPLGEGWKLQLEGSANLSGALAVAVFPDGLRFAGSTGSISGRMAVVGQPGSPWRLLGDSGGMGIEVGGVEISLAFEGSVDDAELVATLQIQGLNLVLDPISGDSFIRDILGAEMQRIGADVDFQWSSRSGFSIGGELQIDLLIPLNLTIGPIEVSCLRLLVEASEETITLDGTISATITLGAITAVLDGIGLQIQADIEETHGGADAEGAFAGLSLGLGFKPPTGLGLTLDTGVVTGGGYLSHDADEGSYAGALELGFANLSLQAIGILTTELPDDNEGWSLLIVISTEFTPIPLGLGLFLEGVGGLFGYNRSVQAEVLQAGIKDHTLDSILFPEDPVADAPQILSDLEAVFPATEGQYVFGPMAKIGWPSPSLIEADLAIVIEAPDPFLILVLGQIAAALPTEDDPLIELHLDVVGVLDFDEGTLAIDASLYDSYVALYCLDGDMALRLGWGGQPTFALAVGGFHPRYNPPEGFPDLDRVSISLDMDNPRIRLEGYFAVTSNSVQFGAELDLYASEVGFTLEGNAGFDVLIVFSPFSFTIDLSFGVTVRAGSVTLAGVDLALSLSGPKPWEVHGTATFKLLGFKTTFDVDLTLPPTGSPESPESVNVQELLMEAILDSRNWSALPSAEDDPGVTLVERSDDVLLVHPAANVELRQTVVPLGIEIEVYSGAPIDGLSRFDLSLVSLGGSECEWSAIEDWFAPGQFFELSDDEKLESPDYELMQAGLSFGSEILEPDDLSVRVVTTFDYESIVYSDDEAAEPVPYTLDADTLLAFTASSATAKTRASARGALRFQAEPSPYRVQDTPWVIALSDNLAAGAVGGLLAGQQTTFIEALRAVQESGDGSLQIVPAQEAWTT